MGSPFKFAFPPSGVHWTITSDKIASWPTNAASLPAFFTSVRKLLCPVKVTLTGTKLCLMITDDGKAFRVFTPSMVSGSGRLVAFWMEAGCVSTSGTSGFLCHYWNTCVLTPLGWLVSVFRYLSPSSLFFHCLQNFSCMKKLYICYVDSSTTSPNGYSCCTQQ